MKQRHADGGYSRSIAFWSSVRARAREVIEHNPVPGEDYCITEIVRCRSQKEIGVPEALDECADRWLDDTLGLSVARVVIVLGKNAEEAIKARYQLSDKGLGVPAADDTQDGRLIGPVELAGRERMIAFLPHPNARMARTFEKVLGSGRLEVLRRWHRSNQS